MRTFIQSITEDQQVGAVMINGDIEYESCPVELYYDDELQCELRGEGECATDNLDWQSGDFGAPSFCTNHYFPLEQIGYEFYSTK